MTVSNLTKTCNRCGKKKPLSAFSLVSNPNARPGLLRTTCKKCAVTMAGDTRKRLMSRDKPSITTKCCSICNQVKPITEFYAKSHAVDGFRMECKVCSGNRDRFRRHGMSPEEFDALKEKQHHVCAICGRDPRTLNKQGFVIDHCHETGIFRGLLCRYCNLAIGLIQDSPDRAHAVLDYLLRHQQLKLVS